MNVDNMVQAYLECALWSSTDENMNSLDKKYDIAAFSKEAVEHAKKDCQNFIDECEDAIESSVHYNNINKDVRMGIDFWLTRNRDGAGFWDGHWSSPEAEILTKASHAMGSVDVYENDGQLFFT